MSLIGLLEAPSLPGSFPGSGEIIPEVLSKSKRARPFYFEDSQVVLQASHSITMSPSVL
jgi:hypothetical protein